jgi:hypothetical protein
MAFQSTTKFLPSSRWFLGSLEFLTEKFGDMSLQEPESSEVTGSGTSHLPPAPVRLGLVNEAQLGHRLGSLGETDMDPTGDKVDHTLAVLTTTTDPIYQPSSGLTLSMTEKSTWWNKVVNCRKNRRRDPIGDRGRNSPRRTFGQGT